MLGALLFLCSTQLFCPTPMDAHFVCHCSLVSERSEQDTIRGVQIRASAIYIYMHINVYGLHVL